ncbi:hypothetical protein BDV93DRAFT_30665 [Ceratobasidium sp. AG-I]|nr:hypothetical protein BDV93DRAFT_30665 [Ceratobasidium sp. AG-I]
MYRNDPRRSQSSNQPWVDPRVGGRRPVFHVLPPDSRPQQPRHMTDPYGRSSGNEEYLSLLSQYVPAPITNYYTHDPSSYTDYPDSRVDFPLHSEPSSDSDDYLSVPEQGFHKRSYSNETRGRPVRSQSKIPEPRSRSSDVAQAHLHKPGHRTKRALRSSFKEGPSPRMEVAFLPDVTVVNFEGRDVTVSSTSLQPEPLASVLEPQKSQQPHRHDQKNDRAIATTTPTEDAFEHLLQHGCLDLSAQLDLHACSSQALAGGRFGDVWRGSLLNGSQVAIKCLRLHAASHGAKSIKRAARELYIWSKAKHQNVLELMGIAMFKGQLAMISRWMTNGTLSEYAFKNPRVDRWALVSKFFLVFNVLKQRCLLNSAYKSQRA